MGENQNGKAQEPPHQIYTGLERGSARKERALVAEEMNSKVIAEGAKAAALWGSGAAAVSLALHHQLVPNKFYARISLPYRIFIVACVSTGAFFTRTDIASLDLDRKFQEKFSITKGVTAIEADVADPSRNASLSFLQRNKTSIIFGVWGSVLAGSLLYNFRRPNITRGQKVINSRMVAQAAVLGGMGLLALSEAVFPSPKGPHRPSTPEREY